MKTEFKIKRHIILDMLSHDEAELLSMNADSEHDIADCWDMATCYEGPFKDLEVIDDKEEFRCSGESTYFSPESISCHYECVQVAIKLSCGTSVSWTYWTGGGKHGNPDSIDWMEHAYEVDCKEEEKMVTVRTYSNRES